MYQKTFGKSEKNLGTFANENPSSISTTYLIAFLISQETPGICPLMKKAFRAILINRGDKDVLFACR